jgi:PAS domain S-box-containing protein
VPPSPDESAIFRAILDGSDDNIYVIGRDLRFMYVSRGALTTLGRTSADLIGHTWQEAGLAPTTERAEAEWRHVLTSGETVRREAEVAMPHGTRISEYVAFPVRSGGEIVAVAVISRDVTARVRAEREIRRADERYRGFIENSSEGIWRFELDEPIPVNLPEEDQVRLMFDRAYLAECNQVVAQMYGFEKIEDILGVRLTKMLDPAETANWDYLRAFVASGWRLENAESAEVDRYGRRKYFVNSLTGIVENGLLMRAWGVQRDITEEKASTERLRLSEERLQALVQASAQVVWIANREGQLEWISSSWTEATGQSHKQAKGFGWVDRIHPEDRGTAVVRWRESVESKKVFDSVVRIRMEDGGDRWCHFRAAPVFNDDGTVREWIGATNDVDAERQQEASLAADQIRTAFISAANDLFVQSLDYEETLRSLARLAVPRLADWCAVDMVEPDGSVRRLAVEHIDPTKRRLAFELQQRYPADKNSDRGVPNVIRTGRTEFMSDIPPALIDAAAQSPEHLQILRTLELRSYIATPIRIRDEVAGVLSLVNSGASRRFGPRDVELAEALALRAGHAIENARLYQQAVDANRAKDDFLATLSHELRTPLTAILGWANLLRLSNYDRNTMQTAIETIERSAKSQAAIIDDLLDVSRIVTGKFQIKPEITDVVPILRSVAESSRPAAEGKRIAIALETPPSLVIRADPNRLQQMIWNLLSNAVKFSNEGGRVVLAVRQVDDDAIISVSDEGAGIAPEILPRVFDRFWQADSSSNRAHGGLGLGLAIVKHLAEMHGGGVSVRSDGVGKGSTFAIRLPVGELTPTAEIGESTVRMPAKRVLLVDDDAGARVVVARMLEHFGARVTEASAAPAAASLLQEQTFDLVLTDLAMPDYDGYWLLNKIRDSKSSVRVVAITALGIPDEELAQAGFDAYVRKPVEPARLAALLKKK